jgi:hypothetical protein
MAKPGYYRDPLGIHFERYFNGALWTYQVRGDADDTNDFFDYELDDELLINLDPPISEAVDVETERWSDFGTDFYNAFGFGWRHSVSVPRVTEGGEGARSGTFLSNYKESRKNESELGTSVGGLLDVGGEIFKKSKRELSDEVFNPSNIADYRSRGVEDPRQEGWIVGQNGMLRFRDGLLEIKRTSIGMDLLTGNLRGDKAIPLRTIQAIQFKPASATVGGMIEFVVAGDRSNNGRPHILGSGQPIIATIIGRRVGRMGNENVITFNRTQQPPFQDLHAFLLNELKHYGQISPATEHVKQTTKAEEIRELKELLDEGLLTTEEFESAKKSILGI